MKLSDAGRTTAVPILPGFEGTSAPAWLIESLREGHAAGVVLFGRNIVDGAQLRELNDQIHEANPAALIAVDEEGGPVSRLAPIHQGMPSAAALGAADDVGMTEDVAAWLGDQMSGLGIDLNLAPVADLGRPDNPVLTGRCFGTDPRRVGEHVAAWVRGLQSQGVAACVKHFPGHGATTLDSHLYAPTLERGWDDLHDHDLVPFVAAIEAGVAAVMPGHLTVSDVDALPATWSGAQLKSKLRGELGFEGLVVSDAMDMAAVAEGGPSGVERAVSAGVGLVCLGGRPSNQAEVAGLATAIAPRAIPSLRVSPSGARPGSVYDRRQELVSRLLAGQGDPVGPGPIGRVFVAEPDWAEGLAIDDPLPSLLRRLLPEADHSGLSVASLSQPDRPGDITLIVLRDSATTPELMGLANELVRGSTRPVLVDTGSEVVVPAAGPLLFSYGEDAMTMTTLVRRLQGRG